MSRDYRKLRVFQFADELVLEVYQITASLPTEEKYGLCSQTRRAAVSVPANVVEGSFRRTGKEYCYFLSVALSSAAETQYLLGLSTRLRLLEPAHCEDLVATYEVLLKSMNQLIQTLGGKAHELESPPYSVPDEEPES